MTTNQTFMTTNQTTTLGDEDFSPAVGAGGARVNHELDPYEEELQNWLLILNHHVSSNTQYAIRNTQYEIRNTCMWPKR